MTIKSTAGPNKGKTFLTNYKVKNQDALHVCDDLSGTDSTIEFKSFKGSEHYLVGYRRQHPDATDTDFQTAELNYE